MSEALSNGSTTIIPIWLGGPGCQNYVQQEMFNASSAVLNERMKTIQQTGGYIISLTPVRVGAQWATILIYTLSMKPYDTCAEDEDED